MNASTSTALRVVGGIVAIVVLAVLLGFIFAPEGRDPALLITPLLALLPPTIASVVLLGQVRDVQEKAAATAAKVDTTAYQVDRLTNGLLDSKVRAAQADVLADHLIDPSARNQIEEDRRVRDAQHIAVTIDEAPHRP